MDWIAACCLFPSLHYDLSLEIGRIIYNSYNRNLSIEDVEIIFGLPWFTEGKIPDKIRKELISEFESSSSEICNKVRNFIATDISFNAPPAGSHAQDLFQEGVLVNELLDNSMKTSSERKLEIENELKEIYSRGVGADIQIESRAETIKNPNSLYQAKRWLFNSYNHPFVGSLILFFLIPFIFISGIYDQAGCEPFQSTNSTVKANFDLSSIYWAEIDRDSILTKSEAFEFCNTSLTKENEDEIFLENTFRKTIYSLSNDLSAYSDNLLTEGSYSDTLKMNLSIDIINRAIWESQDIQGMNIDTLKNDSTFNLLTNQFCKDIIFIDSLLSITNSQDKFAFQDTAKIMYTWCVENYIENCNDLDCKNGGECKNGKCACPPGYSGKNCEIKKEDPQIEDIDTLESVETQIDVYNENLSQDLFNIITKTIRDAKITQSIKNSRNAIIRRFTVQGSTLFVFNPEDRPQAEDLVKSIKTSSGIDVDIKERNRSDIELSARTTKYFLHLKEKEQNTGDPCEQCLEQFSDADNEAPTIRNMPEDIELKGSIDRGNRCYAYPRWEIPTVEDNCAVKDINSSHKSGNRFQEGVTTVTYTAIDVCGNSSFASFKVIVTCNEEGSGDDGVIVLEEKPILVTGQVTDGNSPLIGANVLVKSQNTGTITDKDGGFSLEIDSKSDVLVFSYTGYETQEKSWPRNQHESRTPVELNIIMAAIKRTNFSVDGIVLKENGEALIGAAIQVKGETMGTITDLNGRFTLELPSNKENLEISYTGLNTETISIVPTMFNSNGSLIKSLSITLKANQVISIPKKRIIWLGSEYEKNKRYYESKYEVKIIKYNQAVEFTNLDADVQVIAFLDNLNDLQEFSVFKKLNSTMNNAIPSQTVIKTEKDLNRLYLNKKSKYILEKNLEKWFSKEFDPIPKGEF